MTTPTRFASLNSINRLRHSLEAFALWFICLLTPLRVLLNLLDKPQLNSTFWISHSSTRWTFLAQELARTIQQAQVFTQIFKQRKIHWRGDPPPWTSWWRQDRGFSATSWPLACQEGQDRATRYKCWLTFMMSLHWSSLAHAHLYPLSRACSVALPCARMQSARNTWDASMQVPCKELHSVWPGVMARELLKSNSAQPANLIFGTDIYLHWQQLKIARVLLEEHLNTLHHAAEVDNAAVEDATAGRQTTRKRKLSTKAEEIAEDASLQALLSLSKQNGNKRRRAQDKAPSPPQAAGGILNLCKLDVCTISWLKLNASSK